MSDNSPRLEPRSSVLAGGDSHSLSDPDMPYWLAVTRVRGIGPARFRLLLDYFGSAQAAWCGDAADWLAAGLDTRTAASFTQQRAHINPQAEVERLARLGIGVLREGDAAYPRLLSEIPLPPPLLFVRGTLLPVDDLSVAVVGTRRATTYGRQVTEQICRELVQQGITIVSGLARGIDTCAHTASLSAGGRTLAVLGCGPDLIYPPENAKMAARIIDNGAIVTQFPPGTPPEAGNFPARNRLISGLSLGVVVTEAPRDSGALITARFAGEQGRDVFAVPGSIYSRSSVGALQLIQDGAKLVMAVEDILSELNFTMLPPRVTSHLEPENESEANLLGLLAASGAAQHIDDLCRSSGLPVESVSATLTMLELKGQVKLVGPMTYCVVTSLASG